jgi:hypothetical protein
MYFIDSSWSALIFRHYYATITMVIYVSILLVLRGGKVIDWVVLNDTTLELFYYDAGIEL